MNNCCNCNHEPDRDGSAQLNRYLKALDPKYAPVDDRSIEDLLIFAKRYASQIRFYDMPGSKAEAGTDPATISWSEFFRRDMAVIAASIAILDLEQYKQEYDELRTKLEAKPERDTFRDLFNPILEIAAKIDNWYSLAIPENPLYADLQLAINSSLKGQMQKIVGYEEGFKYVDSKHPLNLDYTAIKNKDIWGLTGNTIDADISIYQGTETEDRIKYAALFVDDIYNAFYSFLSQLLNNSEDYMRFALEQYPAHQPHMALFITFLQLFRLAQDQMNGITARMLDFYYRDVLHLTAKPSIPDKVHIVFELAKDVAEYDVPLNTSLKAGKDASGIDQIYKTENDLVVNQAKIKELKNIFIDKTPSAVTPGSIINTIYARPFANSKDGFGEKFTDLNPKWSTFGKGALSIDDTKNPCSQIASLEDMNRTDQAKIGFAIASPQLVLQGGNRLISFFFNDINKILNVKQRDFEIWLTAEDGWLKIDNGWLINSKLEEKFGEFIKTINDTEIFTLPPELIDLDESYFLDEAANKFYIYLPVAAKGIIPFNIKLHEGHAYNTVHPVMQVMIGPAIGIDYSNTSSISNIFLSVRVGSINKFTSQDAGATAIILPAHFDGLKTLTLQNDNGAIAPGKSFDPFTPYPFPGNSLYIGSNEVFNKPVRELAVNMRHVIAGIDTLFDVASLSAEEKSGKEIYKAYVREKKQWRSLYTEKGRSFTEGALTENILFTKKTDIETEPASGHTLDRNPISYSNEFKEDTYKGFIQIENNITLPSNKTGFTATSADAFELLSKLAPIFKIKEISVSYYSELIQFNNEIDQFFHIYPFGVVETYLNPPVSVPIQPGTDFSTLDKAKEFLLVDARNALLPQFNYLSPYSDPKVVETTATAADNLLVKGPDENAIKKLITRAGNSKAGELMLKAGNIKETIGGNGYSSQYSAGDMQEGMLFIGVEKLKPLQSISMLFQFAEGSAENEDDDPPSINWSYLTYNEWRPLRAENLVSDGTYGFQTTGIIKIDVPEDASAHNTIITDGLIWFCASVTKDADRIPQLVNIVTQAVEAQFEDNNNDQTHFDKALPAGTISKLQTAVAQVSKVQQPFASFDGKHKEIGKEFYTRVSERLRHKGRAINAWDYEHLVLDRFPSVYKVKCITHTDPNCLCRKSPEIIFGFEDGTENATRILFDGDAITINVVLEKIVLALNSNSLINITLVGYGINGSNRNKEIFKVLTGLASTIDNAPIVITPPFIAPARIGSKVFPDETDVTPGSPDFVDIVGYIQTNACCGPQVAPGHVLIVPIADLKNRNAANPLQPKTSRRTLIAIQEYLKPLTSPFVHVHAKNPVYEQIIVSFKVKFYTGTDKGFYMKQLNDEIVHFLTPWAFDEDVDVKFNQKIYASSIINFIEERTYVDFITDFVMGVCCDACCPPVSADAGAVLSGTIRDTAGMPLSGVKVTRTVTQGGESKSTTTNATGGFTFPAVANGGPVILNFYLAGYEPQEVLAGKDTNFEIVLYKFNESLNHICNCNDIEWILQEDPNFDGEIVAEPCSSRSILVSVPQHIIIPYLDPDPASPCQNRSSLLRSLNLNIGGITPAAVINNAQNQPPFIAKPGVIEKLKPRPSKQAPKSRTPKPKATKSRAPKKKIG